MSTPARWDDLWVRVLSGAVLAVIGLGGVWIGGYTFISLVSIIVGLIVWELVRILQPNPNYAAVFLGILSAAASWLAIYFPAGLAVPTLLIPTIIGAFMLREDREIFVPFVMFILAAGFGMSSVRNEFGFIWMLWLVLLVATTDIAGYFAGKSIGGPKFWPSISPKKTWAGIVAGWIAAGLLGLVFMSLTNSGLWLLVLSMAASFASQLGDIAESAVKRRSGVKDSSSLIPGHGGLFDRFDGMLGAAVLVLTVMELTGYPPGPV